MQRLSQSMSLHLWVRMTVRQYRASKKAEADQAAARALSEQPYSQSLQMQDIGGLMQWLAGREAFTISFSNRYNGYKYSLDTMVLTPTCIICAQNTAQQQHSSYQNTRKTGNKRSSGRLQPTAPTFKPHTHTEEHRNAVGAFKNHCIWYGQRAAPWLAEACILVSALHYVAELKHQELFIDHSYHASYLASVLSFKAPEFWQVLERMEMQRSWEHAPRVCSPMLDVLMNFCSQARSLLDNFVHDANVVAAAGPAGVGTGAEEHGGGNGEMADGAATNGVGGADFDDLIDLEDGKDYDYGDIEDGFTTVGRGRKGKGKRSGGNNGR